MNIFWITAIILSRVLLGSADSRACFNCLDVTIHRITTRDVTSVSCPNVTGSEVKFQLWRNKFEIGSVIKKQNQTEINSPFHFQNRTARFILSRLGVNDTGIYTCNAEQLYPPPYAKSAGAHNMVIVEEMPPKVEQYPTEKTPQVWIWVVLGLVTAYSLIVTGIAVGLWHNQTNIQNLQHDYMNMKPRPLRKKQRVQHPVRTGRY